MSSAPLARMVSMTNAARMTRVAMPKRTFASSSSAFTVARFPSIPSANTSFSTSNIASRYNFARFSSSNPVNPRNFSTFFSNAASNSIKKPNGPAPASMPFAQSQTVRHFCKRAWRGDREGMGHGVRDFWHTMFRGRRGRGEHHQHFQEMHKHMHEHWARFGGLRGFHRYHHSGFKRRRPLFFLFRMAALSTILVAVPAVVVFDAPAKTIAYVPMTVFGAGAVLMLTGRLLYVFLPCLAIGGAAVFWVTTMPAANTVKDLKKILKRDENAGRYSSALGTLGSEWEIQKAQPNEWFRWTFPENGAKNQLDKIDIRVAVFDSDDKNNRKAMRCLDKMGMKEDCWRKHRKDSDVFESLQIKRDGNQFLINLEEDGEKIMKQKMAKKYLQLGRIVDRAAKEMEAANPGLKLGEQVVLVHKRRHDDASFWSQWSPYGDFAVRIPFSRTWVNDLNDF